MDNWLELFAILMVTLIVIMIAFPVYKDQDSFNESMMAFHV